VEVERAQILLEEYKEVCRSHAAITDFRAKLLALLPIASGTGVGLLVFQVRGDIPKLGAGLLVALGIFGALVTVGLFFYEIRQIGVCKQLRDHAAWIEKELGIAAGQFGGRPARLSLREVYPLDLRRKKPRRNNDRRGEPASEAPPGNAVDGARELTEERRPLLDRPFVGAEAAGYLIYHAAIAAWLFVAGVGVAKLF
jgi:hypothetical protein